MKITASVLVGLCALFALAMPTFAQLGRQSSGVDFGDSRVSEAEVAIADAFTPDTPADSVFYPFKRFAEGVRNALTFDNAEKARLRLLFALERLAEANDMIKKNKTANAESLLDDFNDDIDETVNITAELKGIGQNVSALVKEVDDVTSKSALVLQLVLQKVPEQARPAIERALNNSLEKKVHAEAETEIGRELPEQAGAGENIGKGIGTGGEISGAVTGRAIGGSNRSSGGGSGKQK